MRSADDVRVRAIRVTDGARLEQFYRELSDESRRTRFFSMCSGLSEAQARSFCRTDHAHREGFVAVARDPATHRERIVGHLCLEPDGGGAEVAIAVADDLQGHGIGRRLMTAGVDWARRHAIDRLTATMLAGNAPINRLLTGLGLPTNGHCVGAGLVEVTIDLVARRAAA
jgi:acetyltransferase